MLIPGVAKLVQACLHGVTATFCSNTCEHVWVSVYDAECGDTAMLNEHGN